MEQYGSWKVIDTPTSHGVPSKQVALAQSLALSGPLTMLLGQRDMGPLVEGLVLEDRPPSEMDLPSARGSEADFGPGPALATQDKGTRWTRKCV